MILVTKRLSLMLFISFIAMFVSCGSKSDNSVILKNLTLEEVDMGQEVLMGRPISIVRSGDYLIVLDNKNDSLVHVFDVARGEYGGQFVAKGEGPQEFGALVILSEIHDNTPSFGLFRTDRQIYYRATIDTGDTLRLIYKEEARLPGGWFVNKLSNGHYLTTNGYCDWYELFVMQDATGKVLGRFGDRMIPDQYRDLPPKTVTGAYQLEPRVSPDGKKIAAISSGNEAAGFYRVNGDSLVMVSQFCNALLNNVFDGGQYLGVHDGTLGFLTAAVNNDFVYILYSGEDFKDSDWTANTIWVYTWNGKKVAEYTLDKRIKVFTAPDASGRAYAITQDGCDPMLVCFDVK